MIRLSSTLLILLAGSTIVKAQAPAPGNPTPQPASNTTAVATPLKAVLILDSELISKTPAGKEFKLRLDAPIKLSNGRVLPRETLFHGVVLQSTAHSKKLPNGALILKIDEARPKGESPIPLNITVQNVGQSFDDDTPPANKDDKKTNSLDASRTGGDAKPTPSQTPQFKKTDMDGVFLALSPQGSAILVAPGAELFLDNPTALSVTIAEPQPKNP